MRYLDAKMLGESSNKMMRPARNKGANPDPVKKPGQLVRPSVQVLAEQRGVDLATVKGTGPRGAITEQDVMDATPTLKPVPPVSGVVPSAPVANPFTIAPPVPPVTPPATAPASPDTP